jgi:glycerol-3-phosphate O-acyltransferase/dihydroxyacetone phosphate acyltransferase
MSMLYTALKPLAEVALHWYYRSVTVAGAERMPRDGPVFLAVNHPNALVDALVVATSVERRVRFTAKSTIFANPVAAAFFRRVGVVPLRRASDEKPAEIATTIPATANPSTAHPAAAHAAAIDPARNAAAFSAVADALAEGAAIVIFPEGKSHDEPALAPLRSGLARMALMAQRERGVRGIRIVPVGLLFERKEEPRSRVLVQIGEPIDVDAFQDGHATMHALTEAVAARLAAVTLNFETADDARRIGLVGDTLAALVEPVRSLGDDLVPLSTTLSLVRRIDRAMRTLQGSDRWRDDAGVAARMALFEERLTRFRGTMNHAGADVHDLAIDPGTTAGLNFAVRESAIALLLSPLVLWGRLTHFAPVRLARALAMRGVKARDEPAMRTIVNGLVLVLLAYAAETTLVGAIAGPWWALLFFASLVPSASADFHYGDRLRRVRRRAHAYFLFRRDAALQPALLAEADWLRTEAAALERLATG